MNQYQFPQPQPVQPAQQQIQPHQPPAAMPPGAQAVQPYFPPGQPAVVPSPVPGQPIEVMGDNTTIAEALAQAGVGQQSVEVPGVVPAPQPGPVVQPPLAPAAAAALPGQVPYGVQPQPAPQPQPQVLPGQAPVAPQPPAVQPQPGQPQPQVQQQVGQVGFAPQAPQTQQIHQVPVAQPQPVPGVQPQPAPAAPPQPQNMEAAFAQRLQSSMAQVDSTLAGEKQRLMSQGLPEGWADYVVQALRVERESAITDALRYERHIVEQGQKADLASTLSAQTGMPVDELMQYRDARSMNAAAQSYQRQNSQMQGIQQQLAAIQQQMGQQQAPPAQSFQDGSPNGVPTVRDIEQRLAAGQISPHNSDYVKLLAAEGII